MPDETTQDEIAPPLRIMQIIIAALCMGVVTFGVILVVGDMAVEEPELGALTLASIGMAVVNGCLSLVLPSLLVSQGCRKIADGTWQQANPQNAVPDTDSGKLVAVYQTTLIIGAALVEGAAFLALAAYMLEGHWAAVVVAGVCLLVMAARIPTRTRLETWLDDQLRRVKEQRQFTS